MRDPVRRALSRRALQRSGVLALTAALTLFGPRVAAPDLAAAFGPIAAVAQTSATEPASRGEKDVGPGAGKEENRRQFPLDLEQPHDILGLGILVAAGLAGALAVGNAIKVLRGERPRATGKWRPR